MDDYIDFLNIYKNIKGRWFLSRRKGSTGIGYTFECLINKKEDFLSLPDFKSIEIKTKRYFGKGTITLLCCAPSNSEYSSKYLVTKYPIYSRKHSKYFFLLEASGNEIVSYGFFQYRLHIDYDLEKIILCIYKNGRLCDTNVYWTFDNIKSKVENKLNKLLIVKTMVRKSNGLDYFNYAKSYYYELISFESFLKAIELGFIKICFNVSHEENNIFVADHGVAFRINEKDLEKVFSFICYF